MNKSAVLDARMNLTLSHITRSVPVCTVYLLLSGDLLLYFHRTHLMHDLITRVSCEAFNMGLL